MCSLSSPPPSHPPTGRDVWRDESSGQTEKQFWRCSTQQANVVWGKAGRQCCFFSAPRSAFCFGGRSAATSKLPPSHHHPLHDITQRYVRLGLPIWAPNMHTLTETDSEGATFCSEVICFLTEEREAIVKERLPKGLVRWGKKRERHQSEINARQSRLVSIKPVTVWV